MEKISYKEFRKLSLKDKVKFFEDRNISFYCNKSREGVYFEVDGEDVFIRFVNNIINELGKIIKIDTLGDYICVKYTIKNVKSSYNEEAYIIPFIEKTAGDLFYEE